MNMRCSSERSCASSTTRHCVPNWCRCPMSLGLRVRQFPRSGRPKAVKSCLVEEISLRAETAIYKLFTFHRAHLCYTVVVITCYGDRVLTDRETTIRESTHETEG